MITAPLRRCAQLVACCAAALLLCRVAEPVYGSREFLRFLLASLAGAGTATFAVVVVVYYVSVAVSARTGEDMQGALL